MMRSFTREKGNFSNIFELFFGGCNFWLDKNGPKLFAPFQIFLKVYVGPKL